MARSDWLLSDHGRFYSVARFGSLAQVRNDKLRRLRKAIGPDDAFDVGGRTSFVFSLGVYGKFDDAVFS